MNSNQLKKITLIFSVILTGACSSPIIEKGSLNVIPLPQEVKEDTIQKPFIIDNSTQIYVVENNERIKKTAEFLSLYINEVTGIKPEVTESKPKSSYISLKLSSEINKKESYRMKVSENVINIEGADEGGVFYGVQTLFKSLPIVIGSQSLAAIPSGEIYDYPRFAYRGFMLDVGRHFFPTSYIKQLIDMLALHNINYFHWHLTEDQGWRIEIKKYPKLTEIGSRRDSTLIDKKNEKYDGKPHIGFYTQKEAREIVKYAAERNITVIPEIDLPGHMSAALASYPELGCTGGPYSIPCKWGVFKDVLCAGNENTLNFVKDVMTEIMDIFPSEYIHVGGDECPKARWKECPKCKAKIKELGLKEKPKHSVENQLQTYFMAEVERFINEHNRRMIGWDEMIEGGITPNSTIMSWRGVKGAVEAAQQNHNAIVAPFHFLYFSNAIWNKLEGWNGTKRVYHFDPVPKGLTKEQQKYIIGAEACIWTEWTPNKSKLEWQALPRMAALSEIQWTNPEKKDFNFFKERMMKLLKKYDLRGYEYRKDVLDQSIIELPADSLK